MSGLIAGFDGSKQTQSLGFLSRSIHPSDSKLRRRHLRAFVVLVELHPSDSKLRRRHLRAFVVLVEIVLEADARGT